LDDKGWKLGSIDTRQSAEEKPQDGYNVAYSSTEGPCAQSGGQAKKASVSSLDFA